MKSLKINSSQPYQVLIGTEILGNTGQYLREYGTDRKIAVVSDDITGRLFGSAVQKSLSAAGFQNCLFSFPNGEPSKNLTTLREIYSFFAREEISRSDLVIALGGGVVGDLTGFAAATWLRGLDYIQIPTTLISQTDSSVGGKTAVDLPEGKNLCGFFHQPRLVICDVALLKGTALIREGITEVIKYGLLADPELFSLLEEKDVSENLEEIVTRSVSIKSRFVAADEFDRGERQLLNLGHTLGHGVEKCSDYTVPHGVAVGIGLSMMLSVCVGNGLLPASVAARLDALLQKFDLPASYGEAPLSDLLSAAFSDKKRIGSDINIIICTGIGTCAIKKIPLDQLEAFIRRGWNGR